LEVGRSPDGCIVTLVLAGRGGESVRLSTDEEMLLQVAMQLIDIVREQATYRGNAARQADLRRAQRLTRQAPAPAVAPAPDEATQQSSGQSSRRSPGRSSGRAPHRVPRQGRGQGGGEDGGEGGGAW
jgi:hypothetical protein